MAKNKKAPAVIASFDDLDAAGIGVGYQPMVEVEPAPKPEAPKSRGLMAVANDTVIEAANAAAGGVSAAANFIKPGNAVSGWIDKNIIEAGEASQSDVVKASKQKFRDDVSQADGMMGELGAVGGYLADAPLLAAAQAAGSFVVPGAAIKGAGLAARAAGAGAKGVVGAGRGAGVAAGAALAGGDAAGTAYELSTKAGATEDEAVAAARGASVIPALVGAAGGAFGAESLLAGARGFGGGMVARAAKTGLSEAAQEAVEEGVTQYEGQRAAMPFDASIDPSKGVAAAAGMGAALGGITGAGTSLLVGDRGRAAPTALDAAVAAERGAAPAALEDQAPAALDASAAGTATPEQLALLEQLQADRSGAHNVSPILDMDSLQRQGVTPAGVLDEAALTRAGLGGAGPAAPAAPANVVPERGALSRAANLAATSAPPAALPVAQADQAQGQPAQADEDTGEVSPEARVVQIEQRLDFLAQMGRTQGWTPQAVAQRSALQQELDILSPAQRLQDLHAQADAADALAANWAGREYRPNSTELPEHAAQGGPVDIQEANEQRRLKSMHRAQQEAAAARGQVQQLENEGNAQAQLAAQHDRAARLEPSAPATAAPDILNRLGKPFTVKLAADRAAKEAGTGWESVKVDGGFVARQMRPSTSTAAPAIPTAPEGVAQAQPAAEHAQDAGARWEGMNPEAQRAVLASTPKLAPVLRKNLEGKAWENISEGNRAKLSTAIAAQAQQEVQQPQPAPAAPVLQNRDRSTPGSVAQMQSIAAAPDYGRLGFSRDFANGAPVVAGGQVAPEQMGKADVAVASDGRRIPVQYAVVEAGDVLPSNTADGAVNAGYGAATDRMRAIAGNGRIAGLQAAYQRGTQAKYQQELAADNLHGVSPEVLARMRNPVLVRIMPADQVSADIGDVSNTMGNLDLSAVEQSRNDAQRVNLDALQFADDGAITPEAVRQFVRSMPQSEHGALLDTNGQPTRQAVDRLNTAVFARAYANDGLVRLYAQAQDPEARLVLSALAKLAPKMARLEGAGALDIRDVVAQAAEIAVNARREGKRLSEAAAQLDMAADPMVGTVLDLFARNPRSNREAIEALGNAADLAYAEANKATEDMFGAVPRASRGDVLNTLEPQRNESASSQSLEQPAGASPVQADVGRPAAEPAAPADLGPAQAGRPAGAGAAATESGTEALARPKPAAPAPAPAPVEGPDLGNGWAAFTPESGTKGVPRAEMPQIKAEHRGAMVNFMNARGIAHQEEMVPAASLKPTQAEFDRTKVQKAIDFQGGQRSILVSRDGHVLDGHHQWLAAWEQGKDVKAIRLDAPIEQLLEAAREFPSSTTSVGAKPSPVAESTSNQAPAPQPAGPTSTPAFKKWFGESKVVSKDGNPLVMYHGTSTSENGQAFTMFDTYASNYGLMGMGGYFTADPEVASSYTSKGKGTTPTVYPVYLSIKNPLDMDGKAVPEAWRKQFPDAENFHEGGDTNESWYRAAEEALSEEGLPKWEGAEVMQDGLRAMGFDGITHIGGGRVKSDGVRHQVFIAFDPEQIKSATGNSGEFDPSSPHIALEDGRKYRAEARRRGYNDGQTDLFQQTNAGKQIELWLDSEPDASQAGPRGEAARSAAAAAVADLYATETILGLALSRDYAARQRVNLVGQEVTSAADLAVLAQVYRDPRFETFRLVFVNDAGKVVSQVGLSSRLPAAATAIVGNDVDAYLRDVSEAARNTGASGFYMLHNHPSGISTASNADRGLTAAFAGRMPMLEFKDHVVIDTNEYTTIDRRGMVQTHHKDFGQPAPMTYGEWGGRKIGGPADIMAMVKQMAVDDKAVTLITLDNQLRVKGVTELAAGAVGADRAANRRAVLKATMRQQASRVVAVGRDMDTLRRLEGAVLDAVMVMDMGEPRSLVERGILQGGDLFPQDRRPRVTGDSSRAFDYLRAKTLPKSQREPGRKVAESDIRFRRTDLVGSVEATPSPGMTPQQAEQLLRIMGRSPQLSRAAQAQPVSTVRATVDAIRAGWANGPEVTVVYDMTDPQIPAAARRADQAQRSGGAEGDPEGFYYDGKVYLLASQLSTAQDAARVLMHEALGHHGLRGVFGKDLDGVLNQIVAVRRGEVRSKAAEYGLDYENPAQRLQAAEEVLAEWAQTRPEMGYVRRAVAAIRTWLRQHVPGLKRLAVTDAEIIRSYLLPARGWVERGAGRSPTAQAATAYSRSDKGGAMIPDVLIGSTLGSASSHPDYPAAKAGNVDAAMRLALDLVTPELVAKVKKQIGVARPRVVPVTAEEAAGRNKIPMAASAVLAGQLGLDVETGIVQANRAHRTGMDGLDRIFAPVDFAGVVKPGPYLLVDDTLTQGGTFAALASHIREGGGTVAGVIALTGKQYSATIQPSPETLASLRQKHGDLENEFRAATGYGFDALTQSEARYLARYEPAQRLRDRIVEAGRAGRAGANAGDPGPSQVSDGPVFSRASFANLKNSALDQLGQALSHPGKVSLWDKTVGTMRHLAERSPAFRPVYESAQRNIDDVSMLANDAADQAPRILPRVDSMGDIVGKNRKRPLSAEDNKAVARPIFEGTLMWGRDVDGKPTLVDDLVKKYANMAVYNKAAMLLRTGKLDAGVLAMWQGLSVQQYEKLIESRFDSKILKAGVVWSDAELKSIFSASPNQISLYREARAAIDRSIDMTARADMLRALGDEYSPMRDAVLDHDTLAGAAQMLLDTMEQDSKAIPDNRDRLAELMQQVRKRLDTAQELQQAGYAPLSRFGRYTVDVVDAAGERQYFGMYETMREANMAARNFRQTFPGATVEQGTMSQQVFKLFAGVTPESLELFGNMLGLDSQGNEAQDKAFQEYLKLTKNNHSAMKRMIHRKGTAGFSQDVGRVVANFVYSNARQAAAGLNVGTLDKAINAIPRDQGELKDLAMSLRGYIQDPQEEGQAIRGMLFAQYLGGSLASAFVNMTQPFQVTLPWLSQHGGMKKAGAQLARALKDMGTKGFQYEADLAKALQSAEDDGVVSPQEIHQLMAQARGAGALRAGDGTAAGNARAAAGNAWERTKVAWGQPFALAEQFNRRSTFIASYRLAKEQGIQNPSAFARHAVLETQFVYSKANKPQWARGTIGGTLFTFKTYSVSYLELMQRMWTQGGAEGKRAVGWSMAMLMLMSGTGGLPFVEDVEDLIDTAGQMMGYSMSTKQARKQFVRDYVGKELADFIEQGISGLPGAPVDIAGRLGMPNLIPGTGLGLEKRDHTRDLVEIIGPAGDLVQRGFSGARDIAKGVFSGDASSIGRGALEMAPTAVRNLAKGIDMADSGVYKDTKGRKVIDVTLAEAAAKAIGFQPKTVAEVQEATGTEQNLISQNRAMKERLSADLAQAMYDRDTEKQQEIRDRARAWNLRNPESPLTIDMQGVRRRVAKMRQTKAERVAAAAPKAIRANVRQALTEAP